MKEGTKKTWLFIVVVLVVVLVWPSVSERLAVSKLEKDTKIPSFREIKTNFEHSYSDPSFWPAVGGAVFDAEGDGIKEIYIGGGSGQEGAVFSVVDGDLVDVTEQVSFAQTSGAVYNAETVDIDLDGDDDMLLIRDEQLFVQLNEPSGYREVAIDLALQDRAVPLSVRAGDIDGDRYPDVYVSTFIKKELFKKATFNDLEHRTENIVLRNNRGQTFTDVTESSGLQFNQNTFYTRFADFDGDGLDDVLVVPNTDQVRIFRNLGSGEFEEVALVSDYGFWMGTAVGDFDSDGDPDVFLSNAGSSMPRFILRGDEREDQMVDVEWRLYRNDGEFEFTDITTNSGLDLGEWAWGAEAADFNQDGRLDLVVLENFMDWPVHRYFANPGRLLIQRSDGQFVPTENSSGTVNKHFGLTPLADDLNGDGLVDLIYLNQNGPARVFLNQPN